MRFAFGQTLCAGAQRIGAINRGQETAPAVILFDSLSLTLSRGERGLLRHPPEGQGESPSGERGSSGGEGVNGTVVIYAR